MLVIKENPSLDEVWDLCVRNFLYDQEKYVSEIVALFEKIGITRKSRIADISAGGGFPAINLTQLGYNIDCFDAFSSELFNANAQHSNTAVTCKKMFWQEIPDTIAKETYDFIFCRGNSFIFAGGGWDELMPKVDIQKVLQDYDTTMQIFSNIIKKNGFIYIDKFKDSEEGHRAKLATIKVGQHNEDLIFSSDRGQNDDMRRVYMERAVKEVVVKKEARITYDLSGKELIAMTKKANFKKIVQINNLMKEERHFDVWLAKK